MNLDEYVAEHGEQRGGVACSVCLLPPDVRDLVNSRKGVYAARTIAGWLTEEAGHPTKKGTVERHMREHVK